MFHGRLVRGWSELELGLSALSVSRDWLTQRRRGRREGEGNVFLREVGWKNGNGARADVLSEKARNVKQGAASKNVPVSLAAIRCRPL
jgi:hypothetical protein